MDGFFSSIDLDRKSLPMATDSPQCGACGLYKKCQSPKMKPYNRGKEKDILIVSESPGEQEDKQGRQLVGNSGKELAEVIRRAGKNLYTDFSLTNALICHPKGNKITDSRMVDYCRPNLLKTIKEENPKVIILLGLKPIQSLIPYLWKPLKNSQNKMDIWYGWTIPSQKINAWVCPTFHPSFLLRMKNPIYDKLFEKHIRKAIRLSDVKRPWNNLRKFDESEVKILKGRYLIEEKLNNLIKLNRPIAFDYETNMLKPDNDNARIVCMSVSNGVKTYAFMVDRSVHEPIRNFLKSDIPKLGWNEKFEMKWSRKIFKCWPKNMTWDGMNNAHILNNREGVTSLKLQSFVRFGQLGYDEEIAPFLEAEGTYKKNRIDEIPEQKLLKYCGMDSLLEWWGCHDQMIEVGKPIDEMPECRLPLRKSYFS